MSHLTNISSHKLTNIKDVKRYLNVASISRDGLLVSKRNHPFTTSSETIILPRTSLMAYWQPSTSNWTTRLVINYRWSYNAISLLWTWITPSPECPPLATPVPLYKSSQVLWLANRLTTPQRLSVSHSLLMSLNGAINWFYSYTRSCQIPDEKYDSLRDALTRLIVDLHPLSGPRAVIRVDPAPSFVSLHNHDGLKHLNVLLEIGRIKNKNPVAEKAVQELEEELLRQEPGCGSVSEAGLAIATARLNSRLRHQGVSSRELWMQATPL